MKFPRVASDLLAAREVIRERGLAKRIEVDCEGRVCARGALNEVIGGNPDAGKVRQRFANRSRRWKEALMRRWLLADRTIAALLENEKHPSEGCMDVPQWNNASERTKEDVLTILDDAASLALSEAVRP